MNFCLVCLLGNPPFRGSFINDMAYQVQNKPIEIPSDLDSDLKDLIRGMIRLNPQQRMNITQIVNHPALTKHIEEFKRPISKIEKDLLVRNFILNLQGNFHRDIPNVVANELAFRNSVTAKSEMHVSEKSFQPNLSIYDLQEIKNSFFDSNIADSYSPKVESKRNLTIQKSNKFIPLEKNFIDEVNGFFSQSIVPVVDENFKCDFPGSVVQPPSQLRGQMTPPIKENGPIHDPRTNQELSFKKQPVVHAFNAPLLPNVQNNPVSSKKVIRQMNDTQINEKEVHLRNDNTVISNPQNPVRMSRSANISKRKIDALPMKEANQEVKFMVSPNSKNFNFIPIKNDAVPGQVPSWVQNAKTIEIPNGQPSHNHFVVQSLSNSRVSNLNNSNIINSPIHLTNDNHYNLRYIPVPPVDPTSKNISNDRKPPLQKGIDQSHIGQPRGLSPINQKVLMAPPIQFNAYYNQQSPQFVQNPLMMSPNMNGSPERSSNLRVVSGAVHENDKPRALSANRHFYQQQGFSQNAFLKK
jgi:hypothetical protein